MTKILIVGGGYAGFYTAWKLEKLLRAGEAEVTVVDPRPYMTYQPFLPEVAAGSINPRAVTVPLRRHLKKTNVITAKVTGISNAEKKATIQPPVGESFEFEYDVLVVTVGAVSRTFPIPGIAENAIGLKSIEEAQYLRDKILTNFDKASLLPAGDERKKLLSFVFVGGGFAGIEGFAETRRYATYLLRFYKSLTMADIHFHLIEAAPGIMPEVSKETAEWVLAHLEEREAHIHLSTQVVNAEDGNVELSTGEVIPADTIVWTAGQMANPMLRGTDLPLEPRGRVRTRADLRVEGDDGILENVWAAGDSSQVPDVTGSGLPFDGSCVPNAQHAVRQAKLLAKNIVASLRGELPKEYVHKPQGAVAGLGLGSGVYTGGKKQFAIKGFIAWAMHRGYHGLAMPTWERKWRVLSSWAGQGFVRTDIESLEAAQTPRAFFEEFAARPKPKVDADAGPVDAKA